MPDNIITPDRTERFEDILAGLRDRNPTPGFGKPSGDDICEWCIFHEDGKGDPGRPNLRLNQTKWVWFCDVCNRGGSLNELEEALGLGPYADDPGSSFEAVHTYRYANGNEMGQVVRFPDKEFRVRRKAADDTWIWDWKTVNRILYHLPEIAATAPDDWIWFVEGEKDADRLQSLGITATTSPHGAGKWRTDLAEPLRRRRVAIIPDNDGPGHRHMNDVGRDLHGYAADVKIVDLPDLPDKGDVSDWLDAGGTKEGLFKLLEAAPAFDPKTVPKEEGKASFLKQPVLVTLADIEPEEVTWLWEGRIAEGKLHVFAGDPDAGKSHVVLAIASAITIGGHLPGQDAALPKGDVLILTAEDGLADTVHPRMTNMKGDVGHVRILTGVKDTDGQRHFSLVDDIAQLETALQEPNRAYRVLIIDPVNAYLPNVNAWADAPIRTALTPLAQLAEKHRVAVLVILHLTKSARDRIMYRVQGSIAYVAAARIAHLVGEIPDSKAAGLRAMVCIKNNLCRKWQTVAFSIDDAPAGVRGSLFSWQGEMHLDASELLVADTKVEPRQSAEDAAADFLLDYLAGGPRPKNDIYKAAKMKGIAWRTVEKAKANLDVPSERKGFGPGSHSEWSLPDHTPPNPPYKEKLAEYGDFVPESRPSEPEKLAVYGEDGGVCEQSDDDLEEETDGQDLT